MKSAIFSQQFLCLLWISAEILVAFIVSAILQEGSETRFRRLPEVTVFNNCFSGRRLFQHHSASSDCTNRKRRFMQQCLCFFWRYHCSYDLCWSSWWGQRCMPGNGVMIRIIISEHFVFVTNTQEIFYYHCVECLKYYRSNVQLKSTVLSAEPKSTSISNGQVDFQMYFFIYPKLSLVI